MVGSGKSYSMVGYGNNKGIVPISCEEIFHRIANDDSGNSYEARIGRWLVVRYWPHWEVVTCCEVLVSAIEIYNEAVQDTLERALHFNYTVNYGGILKAAR